MRHFKQTFVVFVATAINFLFSYAVHFFLGRFLGPSAYGQYGVVLNLFWIIGIPSVAITTSVVKYSAIFNAKKEFGKLKSLLVGSLKFSFLINLAFTVGFILFSGFISDSLGGGLTFLIIIASLSFSFGSLNSIFLTFLQGVGKVYHYSIINSLSSFVKLVFTVVLVLSGFGVFGALSSILFSGLLMALISFVVVKGYFNYKAEKINFSKFFKFGLPVLFASSFFSLALYFDLFFVSSILGAEQAGYYNAAVTLSRAFLMSSAVMAVFFPEFSKNSALNNVKKVRSNIKWALFYTSLICLAGISIFWLFPEFIINLTYSSDYLPSIPILRVLSIGYSFYSLFNVLLAAFWALNKHNLMGFIGLVFFILDIILLSLLVPVYGLTAAAWITSGLFIGLFLVSLILVFRFSK